MIHSKSSSFTTSFASGFVMALALVFFFACQSSPKFPNCTETTTCLPAVEDNAPEAVKAMHETLSGKWKFVSIKKLFCANTADEF